MREILLEGGPLNDETRMLPAGIVHVTIRTVRYGPGGANGPRHMMVGHYLPAADPFLPGLARTRNGVPIYRWNGWFDEPSVPTSM